MIIRDPVHRPDKWHCALGSPLERNYILFYTKYKKVVLNLGSNLKIMTYEQAKTSLENSGVQLNTTSYTMPTNNVGFPAGSQVFTTYKLIDITITPKDKLAIVRAAKVNLSNEDALKHLGLFDSNDLEVVLTFWYEGEHPKEMPLWEYQDYLKDYLS